MTTQTEIVAIQGARIDIERRGKGRPLLLIHGEDGFETGLPLIGKLAKKFSVVAPRLPGFGRSSLPDRLRSIDDTSYLWLDLLDRLDLKSVTVIGFSVGAWLALEIATKNTSRIARMALAGSVGVKFGGAYDRDIEDIYFHDTNTVRAMRFHDPAKDPHRDLIGLSKREAMALAQSREAIAKICWEPYFHNPALRHRLHRANVPVQVIWGAKDRMTLPKYGRALSKALPDGRFASLAGAGHFPHIEQPERFAAALDGFLDSTRGAR